MSRFPSWISSTSQDDIQRLSFGPVQLALVADMVAAVQPFSFILEPGLTEIVGSGDSLRIRTLTELAAERGVEILTGEEDNVVVASSDLVSIFRDLNHHQVDILGLDEVPGHVSDLWADVAGHVWQDGPILAVRGDARVWLSCHDDLYCRLEIRADSNAIYTWAARVLWIAVQAVAAEAGVSKPLPLLDAATVGSALGQEKCFLADRELGEVAVSGLRLPFSRTEWNGRLPVPEPTHVLLGDVVTQTWKVDAL